MADGALPAASAFFLRRTSPRRRDGRLFLRERPVGPPDRRRWSGVQVHAGCRQAGLAPFPFGLTNNFTSKQGLMGGLGSQCSREGVLEGSYTNSTGQQIQLKMVVVISPSTTYA